MRAAGTFSVESFVPADVAGEPAAEQVITTGTPVGVARMEKRYAGEVTGRSATLFVAAFDQQAGVGTYVAMESFEGSLNGSAGTFNFAHAATTSGSDRAGDLFTIVPASGTGELTGVTGAGGISIDADGTHRIWFDYQLT